MSHLKQRLAQPDIDITPAERKVLRALLDNYPRLGLGPMARLARQAGVSDPTILRLVKKLGFAGYGDFQGALLAEVDERIASPRSQLAEKREQLDAGDPWNGYLLNAIDNLHDSLALNRADDIRLLGDWLLEPKARVFCYGGRFSRFLAGYLATHLRLLRNHCQQLDDGPALPDLLVDLDRHAVVVLFDYRRYQTHAQTVASIAKRRGARVVLFTDTYASPLREQADLIISSPVESTSPFDSLLPAMAQVEALITTLVVRSGERLETRLDEIDGLRAAFNTHLLEE